jgi:hypothetical protein
MLDLTLNSNYLVKQLKILKISFVRPPSFVEEIRQEIESERAQDFTAGYRALSLEAVLEKVCKAKGVKPREVAGGGRRAVQCRVREGVAYLWIEWLGHSGVPAARAVGIRPEGVYRVAERGRQQAKYWQ